MLTSNRKIMKKVFMRFNRFVLSVLFMILLSTVMNGQTVKGIVTDENGQALSYSNVIDMGTSNGVTTDGKGVFEIKVKGFPVTLTAKYVGYQH